LNIDVERAVEQPEIYILGQSTASFDSQSKFSKAGADDLEGLRTPLETKQGVMVLLDNLRQATLEVTIPCCMCST